MPQHPTLRIAFAGSAEFPLIADDDAQLALALKQLGLTPTACIWNDATVDWSSFDAVLIRCIWDYFKHYDAFLRWLDRLDALGVPTINNSNLLRWNSDKRYLLELAQHDVAIIPTERVSTATLSSRLQARQGQQLVIKPSISGGAWLTLRGTAGDPAFAAALAQLPPELDYLLQPFVPEIVDDGEWSLLYFAGQFSHAVIKRPAAGDYRVQGEHGGNSAAAVADPVMLAAASRALEAVAALGHGDHAYVRVDGVVSGGRFLIMELEFIEPFLHLANRPDAAERLAREVARRVTAMAAGDACRTAT